MGKEAPVARMVCVVGAQDGVDAVVRRGHPYWVLGEIGSTLMMAVNILPALRVNE